MHESNCIPLQGGRVGCSGRLKFALKSLNDLVAESYGLQDALDDIQMECQDSDDSESVHSAGAFLAWLNDPKPDRIGRLMQEEFKLSGECSRRHCEHGRNFPMEPN